MTVIAPILPPEGLPLFPEGVSREVGMQILEKFLNDMELWVRPKMSETGDVFCLEVMIQSDTAPYATYAEINEELGE